MNTQYNKEILKHIKFVCEENEISPDAFLRKTRYPSLTQRIEENQVVKKATIKRILILLELEVFKTRIKNANTIRQAVKEARAFLEKQDIDLEK